MFVMFAPNSPKEAFLPKAGPMLVDSALSFSSPATTNVA